MEIWESVNTEGPSEATHELLSTYKRDPAQAAGEEAAGCGAQRNSNSSLGSKGRAGETAQLERVSFL